MNIVLIDKEKQYIEKINQKRNLLKNLNLMQAIIFCFFNKGSIIYSKEEKTVLNFCEKILKVPYLYGKIESGLDFENHYAKIKRYEIPVINL